MWYSTYLTVRTGLAFLRPGLRFPRCAGRGLSCALTPTLFPEEESKSDRKAALKGNSEMKLRPVLSLGLWLVIV